MPNPNLLFIDTNIWRVAAPQFRKTPLGAPPFAILFCARRRRPGRSSGANGEQFFACGYFSAFSLSPYVLTPFTSSFHSVLAFFVPRVQLHDGLFA